MTKLVACIKSIRWFEIGVRMGAPLIAILLSIPQVDHSNVMRGVICLIGFFFCWAHGYTLNEWGGYEFDRYDKSRSRKPIISGAILPKEMLILSASFALISILIFAFLNPLLLILIIVDIVIGIFYCHPRIMGKTVPFFSFVSLFVVSVNDFLLGWLVFSSDLIQGILVGIFFGILGLAGISFHEVGDYDTDKELGVMTNAVRYGKRKIFLFGFFFYTLAVIYFVTLTFTGILPGYLYIGFLISYPFYFFLAIKCLKVKTDSVQVKIFIKNYRLTYLGIGIYLIAVLTAFQLSYY